MTEKPTYEELEKKIQELEQEKPKHWRCKIKILFFLSFFAILQLIQGVPIYAKDSIRFSLHQNQPLNFTNDDGLVNGFTIDLLEYVASQEGWQIKYIPGDAVQCLKRLAVGETDLMGAIAYSEKRAEDYDFTNETLINNWGQIYIHPNVDISSILELEGKKIAIIKGGIHTIAIQKILNSFMINSIFIEAPDFQSIFNLIDRGKADAGVVNRLFAIQNESKYNVKMSSIIFNPIEIRFAVTKNKHQDILIALDNHLKKLKADRDSVYYQSLDHWFSIDSRNVIPNWVMWVLGSTVGLIIFFVGMGILLKIQVKNRTSELHQEITERKLTQEELFKNQYFLQKAQEIGQIGTWELNIKKNELFWTDENYRIFGIPIGTGLTYEIFLDCVHPDDREYVDTEWKAAFNKKPYDIEHRLLVDGKVKWVREKAELEFDERGECIRGTGFTQDITERKQAEQSLFREKNLLKAIINNIPIMLTHYDPDANIVYLNKEFEKIVGWKTEEVQDIDLMEKVYPDPDYRQRALEYMQKATQEWSEFKIHSKSGGIIDSEWSNICMEDGTQIGIGIDITERKQAESALKESEEKYRSMMESMKDASYICSPDLYIEYMNPAMIDRVGTDATGKLCYKAIYDRDEKCSWCVFDQIKKGEHVDYEVADPEGNRYYSVSNSPIFHADGTASKLTIFHDITEIKDIEAQLRQSRKMESIGTLAGGIAHDFNNLLYMISGNAELALEDIPKWNPVHTNLEEIKSASLRAAGIVKQLLNFSRKTEKGLKPIGAVTVIKESLKFLRSTIPTTIEIRKHLPDADITILADPVQINQILMNLCINASQAMEDTGGILEVKVEMTTLEEGEIKNFVDLTPGKYLKMTISDTGPGIAEEIINRIFDPYFTTKEIGKGSGMGLSIVHGIVNNHNGAISVDSELGKGTTFSLLFPVVDEKPEIETETMDEIPRGHETILFVDDEKSITDMTQRMLKRLGYKVETSLNPLQALDLFQSEPDTFDLVITDMTMPQMTGAKLSEKLMEIRSDIPVIICTGHSSLIDEEKAMQFGIAGYVMKPASMSTIAKAIRNVLDK